jgi:hypothetical protein
MRVRLTPAPDSDPSFLRGRKPRRQHGLERRKAITTLVRWASFQGLDAFERRMRRMFEDLGVARESLAAADGCATGRR